EGRTQARRQPERGVLVGHRSRAQRSRAQHPRFGARGSEARRAEAVGVFGVMIRRVALYARVSTREQSPDLQLDALRALAAQRGWEIAGEYVDRGVSGTKAKRPELDRLMHDVHTGKVDVVAVWKFDRFARSTQHLVTALNDFRARNVEFVSVQ